MQFKQTVNPLNCEAHVAKNMFWNIHKYPATVHINPLNTTWTRQQSPLPRPPSGKEMNWPPADRKPWDSGVCLNGTTVLLFILFFAVQPARAAPLPGPRPPFSAGDLSQFLGGLHLLLGDLLLRHDGHPRWYRAGDGLLGYVVVVDEGEEAPAAPGALGGVAAVHSNRHAATLLLGREDRSEVTTGLGWK